MTDSPGAIYGSEYLIQHLREVAIEHINGVLVETNDSAQWAIGLMGQRARPL